MRLRMMAAAVAVIAAAAPQAWAQDAPAPPSIEDRGELRVDPATIAMPDINFVETPEIAKNFDKYFFFWREDTSFETALSDIRECDDYARGLSYHVKYPNPYEYGAVYGLFKTSFEEVQDKLYGAAPRRRLRWLNLRICMGYKEYGRYGLPKDLWEPFNFSEGMREISERRRQVYLQLQARVASGSRPAGRVLEP